MFIVYVTDPFGMLGTFSKFGKVLSRLQQHFDKVTPLLKPPDKVVVVIYNLGTEPVSTSDIFVYLAPTEFSIVSSFAGRARNPLLDDGDGWTFIKSATTGGVTTFSAASEVYSDKVPDTDVVAALIFHEAMHNKLHKGKDLHNGDGMAQAVVDATTTVSQANAQSMAAAFRNPVTQWTAGVGEAVARRVRRDQGDPLWYL